MPKKPFQSIDFPTLDRWIREGGLHLAQDALKKIVKSPVARQDALPLCQHLRRVEMTLDTARLLFPLKSSLTESERMEYAIALSKLGAPREAETFLSSIDTNRYPAAITARVLALVSQWKHEETIPLLQSFLKRTELNPYDRLIGKSNLIAALIFCRHYKDAAHELSEFELKAPATHVSFLMGQLALLRVQLAVDQLDLKEARRWLEEVQPRSSHDNGTQQLVWDKWKAVVIALSERPLGEKLKALREVQEKASAMQQWETVRQLDYYLAVIRKDAQLMNKVLFGTPFESLKRRMESDTFEGFRLATEYRWDLGTSTSTNKKRVILPLQPKSKQENQRLLTILCSDFYRPFRLLEIAEQLYEGEPFNPDTSFDKVEKATQSLCKWFTMKKLPLTVEITKRTCRLVAKGPIRIVIPLGTPVAADSKRHKAA